MRHVERSANRPLYAFRRLLIAVLIIALLIHRRILVAKQPKKPAGKCIFCERHGLTHEHIYADWLRDYIPRTAIAHTTQSTLAHLDHEEVSHQRRTGDPHARRLYCVCGDCNNGWMSRLQTAVRPFLVPLLTGKRTTLYKRAQNVLSAWIAMMTMVAEHVDRKHVAIPQADRDFLRLHQIVPPHWRIWIGRHERSQHEMYTHRGLTFVAKEEFESASRQPSGRPNTQTTTICLGQHLLIHVMSSVIAGDIIGRWRLPSDIAAGLVQIWPIKRAAVEWPPEPVFTDAGIALLANEFYNKAVRVIRRRYA
jgi:hypothetical protein